MHVNFFSVRFMFAFKFADGDLYENGFGRKIKKKSLLVIGN